MRLRWEMIEPTFARRAAVAADMPQQQTENAPKVTSDSPRGFTRAEEAVYSAGALGVALAVVALYAVIAFHLAGAATTAAFSLVPVSLAALVVAPEQVRRSQTSTRRNAVSSSALPAVRPRGRMMPTTLRRALAATAAPDGAPWTRPERLYGEVVSLLLVDDEDDFPLPPLEERRRRDLLRRCNVLLATGYRLARRRRSLGAALVPPSDARNADAEHDALLDRLEAENDPATRAVLRESAEMAADRADSLRALNPVLARLEAQEESVCQALLLAHTPLLHQQATPAVLSSLETSSDIAALRQSLRQITQDARAACDAAAEVEATGARSAAGEIAALERRSGVSPTTPAVPPVEEETAIVANRKGGRAAPP